MWWLIKRATFLEPRNGGSRANSREEKEEVYGPCEESLVQAACRSKLGVLKCALVSEGYAEADISIVIDHRQSCMQLSVTQANGGKGKLIALYVLRWERVAKFNPEDVLGISPPEIPPQLSPETAVVQPAAGAEQ